MSQSDNAWFGVAIFALTLLAVLCCLLGLAAILYKCKRGGATRTVWPDVEAGWDAPHLEGKVCQPVAAGSKPELQKTPVDLVETLRGLLKEEIAKALHNEGISERLDRLEQKDEASQSGLQARLGKLEQTASLRDAACVVGQMPQRSGDQATPPSLTFGPTGRQLQLPDPPENSFDVDEDASLKSSLKTIQKQLHRRDMQTTELHRQLRQCQEALWEQTLEARASTKRLRDVLMDPCRVKAEHARELECLQGELQRVSGKLADAKEGEMRWAWIAKRQRAFFLQSEKMGSEAMDLVKRHPAGEVFMAPPPVCLEGDADNCQPWDVGTSHLNPYAIDSWPFEPNVLAARAAAEPGLARLSEDGSGSASPSQSDDASARDDLASDDLCPEDLGTPKPPGQRGPPGAYDVTPPDSPHPGAGPQLSQPM